MLKWMVGCHDKKINLVCLKLKINCVESAWKKSGLWMTRNGQTESLRNKIEKYLWPKVAQNVKSESPWKYKPC